MFAAIGCCVFGGRVSLVCTAVTSTAPDYAAGKASSDDLVRSRRRRRRRRICIHLFCIYHVRGWVFCARRRLRRPHPAAAASSLPTVLAWRLASRWKDETYACSAEVVPVSAGMIIDTPLPHGLVSTPAAASITPCVGWLPAGSKWQTQASQPLNNQAILAHRSSQVPGCSQQSPPLLSVGGVLGIGHELRLGAPRREPSRADPLT